MTTEPVITYTYAGRTPEQSGEFYGQAHAWQDFITETIDEDMATLWLEAYDHATEQWEYDMPNPLDVWDELYKPTTQATTHDHAHDHVGDHTYDHTRTDDHTRAQAQASADRYAWARTYASAYRDATAKLMRDIIEKARVEPVSRDTQDNNSMAGEYGV